jgi:hypothetical protein
MVCKDNFHYYEEVVFYDAVGEEVSVNQEDLDRGIIDNLPPHVICTTCDEERIENEFFLLNQDRTPSHDLKLLTYYKE